MAEGEGAGTATVERPTDAGAGNSGGGTSTETPAGEGSSSSTGTEGGKTDGQSPNGASGAAAAEFEVVVDGQKLKVTREELLAGYSRQADYTRKTQELAAKGKQFESDFSKRVSEAVREAMARERQEREEAREREENPPDPLNELRSQNERLAAEISNDKLERTLDSLRKDFPLIGNPGSVQEKLFLTEVSKRRVDRFEDLRPLAEEYQKLMETEQSSLFERLAGDDKHPISSKWRQKIIDDYLAAKAKEGKSKTETGGTGAPGGVGKRAAPKDFNEADKLALEALERAAD